MIAGAGNVWNKWTWAMASLLALASASMSQEKATRDAPTRDAPTRNVPTRDVPRDPPRPKLVKSARPDLPKAFSKTVPDSVQDLKEIQTHVQKIVAKVSPAVVGLLIGPTQGSGVVINKDGLILTAGHVSAKAGRKVRILFPDGKSLNGETLGANYGIDSGMVRITDKVAFPYCDISDPGLATRGDWCMAIGHPNGYQPGRAPVVRVGRVLSASNREIRSDCTLVGGDSGGPLFDMHGNVMGIHSRIGGSISFNIHVPISTYVETWDRLASAEEWGQNPFANFAKKGEAWLGIRPHPDNESKLVRILSVSEKSPAEMAGLKENDVILKFDDKQVTSTKEFSTLLSSRRPGARISLEIRRGEETMTIQITLAPRPN